MLAKLFKSNTFFIIVLFIFSVAYFFRLFYPTWSVFITPDVYSSDLIHLNYSLKNILAESLKNNQLPYWNWLIGNGFPLIGESQIGAFYLMNLILFRALPTIMAFNIGYILTFFITSVGFFLLTTRFVNNKMICFFGAIIYSYSAPMFVQISHYNLLQAYSLIPLIFYFSKVFLDSNNTKHIYLLIVTFLLSQQFFAGYAMTSFMTLLLLFCYFLLHQILNRKDKKIYLRNILINNMLLFALLSVGVIVLSLSQFIPLVEFAKYSVREKTDGYISTANSMPISILLTYTNFNYFQTFTTLIKSTSTIVNFAKLRNLLWDSNLYFGAIPFFTVFITLLYHLKNNSGKILLILYSLSILLAAGNNSPLGFLYGIPPFSFFRTPFRFTIFMTFFLCMIYVLSLDILWNKLKKHLKMSFIIFFIVVLNGYTIYDLVKNSYFYHQTTPVKNLTDNNIASFLQKDGKDVIYSFGNEIIWYQTFLYKRWDQQEIYQFFLKDLGSYFNTIFNFKSANIFYASYFAPKKQFYFDNLIRLTLIKELNDKGIYFSFDSVGNYNYFLTRVYKDEYNLSNKALTLLKLKGIKYLITPFNYKSKGIKKVYELKKKYDNNYYYNRVYEISNPYPSFYLTNNYYQINSNKDVSNLLELQHDPIVFGYKNIQIESKNKANYKITSYKAGSNKIEVDLVSDNPALLISTISNYPGLQIYSNGKLSEKLEVNFNQIAVRINKGAHKITIIYEPYWLSFSLILTLIANIALFLWIILLKRIKFSIRF